MGEERRLPENRDDHRVGDHAAEDRRDERVRLEVVPVEHLDRQDGRAERRAEHRRHTRGHADQKQDATLPRRHPQIAPDHRTDGAANLHGGPLAPAGPAEAQGED